LSAALRHAFGRSRRGGGAAAILLLASLLATTACGTRHGPPAPVVRGGDYRGGDNAGAVTTTARPAPPVYGQGQPSWQNPSPRQPPQLQQQPVVRNQPAPPAPSAALAPAPIAPASLSNPDSIVVQPGQTLYAVSRQYSVPIRSLIEANGLTPPYHMTAGRTLTLPKVRQHIVQPGDTLYSISRRYGVDASTLARSNEMQPPYTVKLGTGLILPAPVQPELPQTAVAAAPLDDASPPLPGTKPRPPGDAIASAPPPEAPVPGAPSPPDPPAPQQQQIAAATPPPPTSSAEAKPLPQAPQRSGRGFAWPVRGRLLSSFGPSESGTHNDGINIAAPQNTPIVAADDGIVAYAGNELRGFGNLILLKHADGWMTAYAHCDALYVSRGERVKRGQTIARVGATGSVSEPQLHFEIRRGTRALDPSSYLGPLQSAGASGGGGKDGAG
jgi:murein DD-endopeptidase MepM/ murein hydrolase activator NlpD